MKKSRFCLFAARFRALRAVSFPGTATILLFASPAFAVTATGTAKLIAAFTNSVFGVAQDLIFLFDGPDLTFNATSDTGRRSRCCNPANPSGRQLQCGS